MSWLTNQSRPHHPATSPPQTVSFRIFIYYCALCGGWGAFVAWALSEILGLRLIESGLFYSAALGGMLGLLIAGAVGTLDARLNAPAGNRSARIIVSIFFGLIGGVAGGFFCEVLTMVNPWLRFLGWMIVGVAIGSSIALYEFGEALLSQRVPRLAGQKLIHGVLGGALGGMTGGLLFTILDLTELKNSMPRASLALGLVTLGTFVGLLIGLTQILLKEAWVEVEAGFRPGRQMILSKAETTIGRAETCDLALPGEGIEFIHARISFEDGRYILADAGSSEGTFLNDHKLSQSAPLRSGDRIRVGGNLLTFGERRKDSS
jgi:MFS family permease